MDNSNKVLNPSSGRYVKKSSTLGKMILAGKTPPQKASKSCADNKIKNPKSGRCIKMNGRLAKSLNNSPATSSTSSSSVRSLPNVYNNSSSSSPLALPITNSSVAPPLPEKLTTISENKKIRDAQLSTAFVNILKTNPNATPEQLGNKYIGELKNVNATTLQSAFRQKLARNKLKTQNIEYSKSLFNKSTSLPKSNIDILEVVKKVNTKIKNVNKPKKDKNVASNNIQRVFRGYLARKKTPLNFQDAPDYPQPLTTVQADAILDKRMKKSKDIEYSKSLFNKSTSLPKSSIDILKVVKNVNTNIKNVNKPKIKIKRTNKRNSMDIDTYKPRKKKSGKFYRNANKTIRNIVPALASAGFAVGLGMNNIV